MTLIFLSTPSARRATAAAPGGLLSAVFLSTPSARRATGTRHSGGTLLSKFLSTPSARRATPCPVRHDTQPNRFLSTPSARRATRSGAGARETCRFLSTPSARRATSSTNRSGAGARDFYPRPPRGGRLSAVQVLDMVLNISIHALREEGDVDLAAAIDRIHISIHALREEGDPWQTRRFNHDVHFYPRPPRGGRRPDARSVVYSVCISIHALREEGDVEDLPEEWTDETFLSTPSARRATCQRFY